MWMSSTGLLARAVHSLHFLEPGIDMLEQQRHPFLPFDNEGETVAHLRAVEILVNKDIVDPIVVEELDFLIAKKVPHPQLHTKVLYYSD